MKPPTARKRTNPVFFEKKKPVRMINLVFIQTFHLSMIGLKFSSTQNPPVMVQPPTPHCVVYLLCLNSKSKLWLILSLNPLACVFLFSFFLFFSPAVMIPSFGPN